MVSMSWNDLSELWLENGIMFPTLIFLILKFQKQMKAEQL